jgi:hypothetical protein
MGEYSTKFQYKTHFLFLIIPGDYIFTVNGRKRSYVIHAKSYEEATKWTSAIQDVSYSSCCDFALIYFSVNCFVFTYNILLFRLLTLNLRSILRLQNLWLKWRYGVSDLFYSTFLSSDYAQQAKRFKVWLNEHSLSTNISHEINSFIRTKDKLIFTRNNYFRQWVQVFTHPYFADTISREEFRRRGSRP